MRILIVDDSAFMRKALRSAVESEPGVEVIGIARDGEQAVAMTAELKPDLVTLDVEMPGVDGLTALHRIMRDCPTRVVIISSLTTKGSQAAITAYKLGAIEVIAKDAGDAQAGNMSGAGEQLRRLVAAIRESEGHKATPAAAPPSALDRFDLPGAVDLIAIGSSTGGPPVLEKLIASIPPTLGVPVVIAQHMPLVFTQSMAERFDSLCAVPVRHIENGSTIEAGTVSICPGGSNTHLGRAGGIIRTTVNRLPEHTTYFPSVNVLFDTASQAARGRVLGFVLTGMGDDGEQGARTLVERGGTVIAQDEPSSVSYGMPRAVTDAGLARHSGNPDQLAAFLARVTAAAHARAA